MKQEELKEIWKPVVGFEGYYEVSDLGRVRTLTRKVSLNYKPHVRNSRVLVSRHNRRHKYLSVEFSVNKKRSIHTVHRLVAKAFIPNPENKPEVNHKNGVKTDNKRRNLEWATRKENAQHAIDTGLRVLIKGSDHWNSTLTDHDVLDIRYCGGEGVSAKFINRYYKVSYSSICRIMKGTTWTHLDIEVSFRPFISTKVASILWNFESGKAIDKSKVTK